MECPRCAIALSKQTIREVHDTIEIDTCESCGGIWLDKGEIAPLERVSKPTFWEVRKIPREIDQLVGLNCPSCADHPLMAKAEHDRDEHVILDYCDVCGGTWLDKGELDAIQEETWWEAIKALLARL